MECVSIIICDGRVLHRSAVGVSHIHRSVMGVSYIDLWWVCLT